MSQSTEIDGFERLSRLVASEELRKLTDFDKRYPIVLVPGFSGWGPPLLGAVNYWGGVEDIPKMLKDKGYTVIIATIAPLSSNWERASELYAQLTAGRFSTVDPTTNKVVETLDLEVLYGTYFGSDPQKAPESRSTKNRRRAIVLPGKTWPENPSWVWSKTNKVHFICHSQGGNTVRQLLGLMRNGAGGLHDEYFKDDHEHKGRDNWAISVSTLGTPYKGTTITNVLEHLLSESTEEVAQLTGRLFATLSFQDPATRAYDLQLDHWGIRRLHSESFQAMRARLEAPGGPVSRWLNGQHTAFHDNSIQGVEELHKRAGPPSPHVCYLTFSFDCTEPFPSSWPPWTSQAVARFPISIYDLLRQVFLGIPGGPAVVWVLDLLRQGLTNVLIWPVFQGLVKFRDFLNWATVEVAEKLLKTQGFPINLPRPGKYVPRGDVFPPMLPTVYAMGSLELTDDQKTILGPERGDWLLNDGIVNTMSMRGPKGATIHELAHDPFPLATGSTAGVRGRYWHFGTTGYLDHADEIGVWVERDTGSALKKMYQDLADLVSRIPPPS